MLCITPHTPTLTHHFTLTLLTQTGQSGLGKSTLINSLFMTDVYEDSTYPDPVIRMPQTTQVRSQPRTATYHIAGNFRGRKLSWIGRKGAFRGENFRGMLKLVA
ncbi:MAG: septin family protein [Proteobacteria bacterium]|nr:septin family protein [Pseudomonadota bacterium]